MSTRVWPGRPYPLGATWDGAGVKGLGVGMLALGLWRFRLAMR